MDTVLTACFCDKNTQSYRAKYTISHKEHMDIAAKLGDSAVLLYMHYLRMAATDHPVITDANAAVSLGWHERKAQKYRLALTRLGYYKQIHFTRTDGVKMIIYHVGQEAVGKTLPQTKD